MYESVAMPLKMRPSLFETLQPQNVGGGGGGGGGGRGSLAALGVGLGMGLL